MAVNFYPPQNTTDKLMEEMLYQRSTQQKIMKIFAQSGYCEVQTPAFEYYDLFSPEYVTLGETDIFKFVDGDGKILALRPDLTTPIARIAATKLKEEPLPLRLSYCADVFRSAKDRPRQSTQIGLELIGINCAAADAEVIMTAIDAIKAAGLSDFQVEVGQSEFFCGILDDLALAPKEVEEFKTLIDHKDQLGLSAYLNGLSIRGELMELIEKLPSLFGDMETIDEIDPSILNEKSRQALYNLREICRILRSCGYDRYISIDLAMVQSINYYTGVIFKAFARGAGFSIASGGRYDNLIGNFGRALPATGCAIDLDYLISVLRRQTGMKMDKNADILVFLELGREAEAYETASLLRQNGWIAELYLSGGGLEACLKYAKTRGIPSVLRREADGSLIQIDPDSRERGSFNWEQGGEEK
jgi:ATP phosphoribosyltransferase regulatory subunit